MTTDDALALILHELRALRVDIVGARQPRLAAADYALLMIILPVIVAAVADRAFTVRELLDHAELPNQSNLRTALAGVGGARRLGRLLRRADGVRVDGLHVCCVGNDSAGLVWVVKVVGNGVVTLKTIAA